MILENKETEKQSTMRSGSGYLTKSKFAIEAMKCLIKTGKISINKDKRAEKLAELSWEIAEEMFKKQ